MQTVEMHGSYVFDCPECGVENFQRRVTEYLNPKNPEDAEIIERTWGLEALHDEKMSFRFATYPNTVICKSCGRVFRASSPDSRVQDEDGDGDEFDSEMEL